MSKFEDQSDDLNVVCPYCKKAYQAEGEDYSEDSREEECGYCEKKFHRHETFSVTHHTSPDCKLNGGEHDFELITFRNGRSAPFCTICDAIQPIADRPTEPQPTNTEK